MKTQVRKLMTPNLITVPTHSSLADAQEIMKKHQIRHLPVVSHDGDIIGILSHKELMSISESKVIPVDVVMNAPVHSVNENLPLRQAIREMIHFKISSLLITNTEDDVVGILTTDDLLNYLAHLLEKEREEGAHNPMDPMNLQRIGEVANQISMLGI